VSVSPEQQKGFASRFIGKKRFAAILSPGVLLKILKAQIMTVVRILTGTA